MVVKVCIGSACHVKGSYLIVNRLKELIKNNSLESKVELKASFCINRCMDAVAVEVDGQIYSVSPETVDDFFKKYVRR